MKIPRKKKKKFIKKLKTWNESHDYRLPYCFENYEFLMQGKKKMVAYLKFDKRG